MKDTHNKNTHNQVTTYIFKYVHKYVCKQKCLKLDIYTYVNMYKSN